MSFLGHLLFWGGERRAGDLDSVAAGHRTPAPGPAPGLHDACSGDPIRKRRAGKKPMGSLPDLPPKNIYIYIYGKQQRDVVEIQRKNK